MMRYGGTAALIDVVSHLLRTPRAGSPQYRDWLADRLLALHAEQSEILHPAVPEAYHSWAYRRDLLIEQIERTIPAGDPIILVDDAQLDLGDCVSGRRTRPLIEQDGQYWGLPDDAAHAIDALERHRASGCRWLVVAWPSSWYLEVYAKLRQHLQKNCASRSSSPHARVFELMDHGPALLR
jgi:hypothetical protein